MVARFPGSSLQLSLVRLCSKASLGLSVVAIQEWWHLSPGGSVAIQEWWHLSPNIGVTVVLPIGRDQRRSFRGGEHVHRNR